jgi:hypothetical protein
MKIKSIQYNHTSTTVYDFTVQDAHHYILSNGIISHNSYVPMKTMSGGGGLKYAASQIIMLTKRKDRDKDKEIVGSIIGCTMTKSRFTKEGKKIEVQLSHTSGLNRYFGLLELSEAAGLAKREGNKWLFPNDERGSQKEIASEPERFFTVDLLNQLEVIVGKEFKYGSESNLIPTVEEE